MILHESDRQGCQEYLGHQDHLGLPWDLGGQVDPEGPRRRFPSRSGKILVGPVGLARLPLEDLWVLVGLGWKALVALVGQVGRGDPASQLLGQRGPRRWSCHCL